MTRIRRLEEDGRKKVGVSQHCCGQASHGVLLQDKKIEDMMSSGRVAVRTGCEL